MAKLKYTCKEIYFCLSSCFVFFKISWNIFQMRLVHSILLWTSDILYVVNPGVLILQERLDLTLFQVHFTCAVVWSVWRVEVINPGLLINMIPFSQKYLCMTKLFCSLSQYVSPFSCSNSAVCYFLEFIALDSHENISSVSFRKLLGS